MTQQLTLEIEPSEPTGPGPEKFLKAPLSGSGWQVRNWCGYFQHREWVEGSPGPWCIYVTGFSGPDCETAHVQLWPEGTRAHRMTKGDSLVIDGQYFGRDRWDH